MLIGQGSIGHYRILHRGSLSYIDRIIPAGWFRCDSTGISGKVESQPIVYTPGPAKDFALARVLEYRTVLDRPQWINNVPK
jgi:hypothetical protein